MQFFKRIIFNIIGLTGLLCVISGQVQADKKVDVSKAGAVGDGTTLNTPAIQKVIDDCAAKRGCTLVFPKGVFLTGAIFLKKGVNLHLAEGAVIKGSTDIRDYPKGRTRIEGQITDWIPALINADQVDNLRISGTGTLDGNGQFFYTAFWDARKKDPRVTNLGVERPRMVFIQNSKHVKVSGIKFLNSGFWNLHLYRSTDVVIENVRFEAPYGAPPLRGPSTDGIDIDSCQRVTVRKCFFAVNDDAVCLKGTKGPFAMDDKNSPPTEDIRVTDCEFKAGHGVVTLGSEATIVRNVIVENSRVTGKIPLIRLKLRPDTPQLYENIHYRNITLTGNEPASKDDIFEVLPWTQFFDLKGQPPPKSIVRNITLTNIKGTFGSLGVIQGNPNQTDISDITLKKVNVQLKNENFKVVNVKNLKIENVIVNGKSFVLSQ